MERNRGSITVFMTFVLLIMIGFICVMLEGARYYETKAFTKSSLYAASEATATEYYRPLFQDYHVFYMARGSKGEEEFLGEKMNRYLDYSLSPAINNTLWKYTYSKMQKNLVTPELDKFAIKNVVSAVNDGGNNFQLQAVSFMQYKSIDILKDKLLQNLQLLNSVQNTSKVLEQKVQAQESMGELDKDVLKIMQYIDGIKVTQKGRVKISDYFSKQMSPLPVGQQNMSINQSELWIKLKNKYIDVNNCFKQMISCYDLITEIEEEMELARSEFQEGSESKKKEKDLLSKESELAIEKEVEFTRLNQLRGVIIQHALNIKKCNNSAINVMKELEGKQIKANREVEKYEKVLEKQKDSLEKDVYDDLNDDSKKMKEYVGNSASEQSEIQRIRNMQPLLEENNLILDEIVALLKERANSGCELKQEMRDSYVSCIERFKNYHYKELSFDYSKLKLDENVQNPITKMKSLLGTSIFKLVVSPEQKISKKSLGQADELWKEYGSGSKNSSDKTDTKIGDIMSNIDEEEVSGLFKTNEEIDVLGDVKEFILFVQYLKEHLSSFVPKDKQREKVDSLHAIDYEQEYLAISQSEDKQNIQGVVERIVALRTVMNFLSILADKEKASLAYETAVLLVGFTGLEPLIELTKTLILIVWSFDESLVDTAAIIQGNDVPFFKSAKNFLLSYQELLLVDNDLIMKKAKRYSDSNNSLNGFGYDEYMMLFLMIQGRDKLSYRALDLIDANMKLRYTKEFDIRKTIYGFTYKGEFTCKNKFLLLPVTGMLNLDKELCWKFQMDISNYYS